MSQYNLERNQSSKSKLEPIFKNDRKIEKEAEEGEEDAQIRRSFFSLAQILSDKKE